MKKATHFYELAAMSGDVCARHRLGLMEYNAGNHQRAMKHFIVAARAGDSEGLEKVKEGFIASLVTKNEYVHSMKVKLRQRMRRGTKLQLF